MSFMQSRESVITWGVVSFLGPASVQHADHVSWWSSHASDVLTFAITFLAAGLVGVIGYFRRWRGRDRQLSRLESLVTLHESPIIDDEDREQLAQRIRSETSDYLYGDLYRRPMYVQQVSYILLCALAIAILALGSIQHGWVRYGAFALGILILILAIGITGMPAYKWRMPKAFLSSQDTSTVRIPKTSPLRQALPAVNLKAGDAVLLYGCNNGYEFAALRAEVGDSGKVVGIDKPQQIEWARQRIMLRGWRNVDALDDSITTLQESSFDAVLALHNLLKPTEELSVTIAGMHYVLRPGGRIFLQGMETSFRRRGPTVDNLLSLVEEYFIDVEAEGFERAGMKLLEVKASKAQNSKVLHT
jgi:methyltransferase family protein